MSPFSSLLSASALAICVAWSGATAAAPVPMPKPAAAKDAKAKDTKTKSAKPKEAAKPSAKDSKSKDAKGKDAKPASAGADKPAQAGSAQAKGGPLPRPSAAARTAAAPVAAAPAIAATGSIASGGDLSVLKTAVAAARSSRAREAMAAAAQLNDPVAQKLVTWLVVRQSPNDLGFNAVDEFIRENPGWPTQSTLRRRAERVLFQENRDLNAAQRFFAEQAPISGEGKVAFARVLAASGQSAKAAEWVREAYRDDDLNELFENRILEEFGSVIGRADHKARADRFSYKPDTDRALRAASRAGSDVVALTKARLAVARREGNGERLLSQVPFGFSSDPAYLFAKSQVNRRADKPAEAAQALIAGAKSPAAAIDPDEWWIESRLVSRELLDMGDARTAYRVAAAAPTPSANNYRAEQQFTAGWIALRFLKDPRTAAAHFAKIGENQKHPITLSRAYYWQARAAEAMGDNGTARARYEAAGRHPSTYYGQLARTRLGAAPVALRGTPSGGFNSRSEFSRLEAVKAIRLLYAIGERDIPLTIYYDLAWRLEDPAHLGMLAKLAESAGDARGALVVGKEGLAEGHPLDAEAFPTFGLPSYTPIGHPVDKAAVYAIARQESQFNPRTLSGAKAMGLMQVTPAAGRQVAKITGAPYSEQRLMSDQSYNVQFGAAEIGELVDLYDGNYVLAFAAYNAGRGSVKKWIDRYGDPRDPNVDVVDWVEQIPFSETRNYVQRVMENYQVYKVRFNIPSKLQMEADLRGSRSR